MSASYPQPPGKPVYKHCPKCNDHATTLQQKIEFDPISAAPSASHLYCPNCGWNDLTTLAHPDDLKRIKEEEEPTPVKMCVGTCYHCGKIIWATDSYYSTDDHYYCLLHPPRPEPMFEPPQTHSPETCYGCGKQVHHLDTNQTTSPESIGNFSSIDGQIRCPACFSAFLQQLLKSETVYKAPNHPPQVEVVPGALSTPGIAYQLIPPIVWERGAKRFMLGEERKGDKAWNADSANQHILTNKKFILDRLAHTMAHTLKLMDKIRNDKDLTDDDDAAAIWWGASFAICATDALTKEKNDLATI